MSWFASRMAMEEADPFCRTEIIREPNGDRTVLIARDVIQINEPYERLHHPDWFREDGSYVLDTAGEWVYRPVDDHRRFPTLREGFVPYQRTTEEQP